MSDPVGSDLNRDLEKDVDLNSSRKRSRPTSWTKEESIALYEVLEGLSADERGVQKEAMWEIVSGRMGNTKNSTECKVFHENTLQQYIYRHGSASSAVPYTQLKEFVQQEFASTEPSPSERAISVSFEGCQTSIDISACSEVVAAATIRSTFGLDDAQVFWLVDEFDTKYGIDRKIPPGNYSLHLAKSESAMDKGRFITIKCDTVSKEFGIDEDSPEAIKEAVRAFFGGTFINRPFYLEDENKIVRTIHKNMPLGTYYIFRSRGITIRLLTNERSVTMKKTFYSEDQFFRFLRRRQLIGLQNPVTDEIVDEMDELKHNWIYREVKHLSCSPHVNIAARENNEDQTRSIQPKRENF